jgi:glutaredoxin/glutathione-dependent peroxiredoxin
MTIAVGGHAPQGKFKIIGADGPSEVEASSVFGSGTVVLVGVPGAFTPTCNDNHVPGYLENADALKSRGVNEIYVISANDHFVMKAWQKNLSSAGKVVMISDWDASYAKALGMEVDLGFVGLGQRARRFSILFKDGVAQAVNTEDNPGAVDKTSAATMIEAL